MPGPARIHGPESARCEVLVFREGLLSAIGHDLLLRATALEVVVGADGRTVEARIDARSLRVATALRDGEPLPDALRPSDLHDIEQAIAKDVLHAARFPEIRFVSSDVQRTDGGHEVHGSLSLAGATRPVVLAVRREGDRLATEVTLHQPDYGVKPYRAMLGALRVKPDVVVRASIPAQ
jgi:polyisoprenoid-binding protein YceI